MRALKGMFMTCCARTHALSNQLAGWGAGHESRINPNNLRQVRGSISSLLLVWFAGDMKSVCPSNDDAQHCRCVVWEGKIVLQSVDVAFSAPHQVRKALSFASFIPAKADVDWLCFKEILVLAERESGRFSPWQSEHL